MAAPTSDRRPVLDKDALIPVTVILAPIVFSFWLGGRLNGLDARLMNIESAVESANANNVEAAAFRVWMANFRAQNPEIEVPPLPANGGSK